MNLKFIKNGTIYKSTAIHTPAGIFTGEELFENREDLRGAIIETNLSEIGWKRITGNFDFEDKEFDYEKRQPAPESFHAIIEGWGWCLIELTL